MNQRNRQDGFTLIELLIVVVIIGILAAIAIPKFNSAREKSYIAAMKADLRNLATQQEVYHNTNYTYAGTVADASLVESDGVTITIAEATGRGWSATAAHVGLPGESCGIYHGNATPVTPATVVSTVECSR